MIDSEPLQHLAFNQYLGSRYGIQLSDAEFTPMVGHHERQNWEGLREQYGLREDVETLSDGRNSVYLAILEQHLQPMPGLVDLVRRLRLHDIRLAVASSSPMEQIQMVVAGLALSDAFRALVSGYEVQRSKPDPAIMLLAASRLDVSPSACLVLEDSSAGIQAAKAAGMVGVAVPNAYTRHQDLSLADAVLTTLQGVTPQLIERLGLREHRYSTSA